MNNVLNSTTIAVGRALLGLYFLVPGIFKITQYQNHLDLMLSKSIPFSEILLPVTAALQIALGVFLIIGKYVKVSALLLFGMTILINLGIHNFWALSGDPSYAHELQNFIKNLGIAAGLLVLSGSSGKLDSR